MIRKAIFWAAAFYLGTRAHRYITAAPRQPSVEAPPDEPLNPVISPELAERLRPLVATTG